MTMKRFALAAALALAVPIGVSAQEAAPPEGRQRRTAEQRAEMRERIQERFLDMATERLELDANQRSRLAAVLDQHAEERRELAEEGMRLRHEAADLLGADEPDAARAQSILDRLTRLRERELQLWRTEQDALADVLSAPQRLELMAMQARLNERVRDLRHDRGPRGPGRGQGMMPRGGFGGRP